MGDKPRVAPPRRGEEPVSIAPMEDRTREPTPELVELGDVQQHLLELKGHQEFQEKLIDSVREALLVLDRDLKVVQANLPFYETFGISASESEGCLIYDLGGGQWDVPNLRRLLEDVLPDDHAFDDVEVEQVFEGIGPRVMLLNGRRIDHLDLILLTIRDVTELRRMEAQQRTLVRELHHRVTNILASVGGLARLVVRESSSLDDFKQAFQTRLDALARTQDLLLRAPERETDLADILRMELEAQGGREGTNFHLSGPEILFSPQATQAFAMAVHELVTNAIKHGALARPGGKVAVEWGFTAPEGEGDAQTIAFHWREHCAGINPEPDRNGHGMRVMGGVFRHSLQGTWEFTLHPDGAELYAWFRPS